MTGEPTHNGAARPNYRLKLRYPLRFIVNYFQLVTQHFRSRTVRKPPLLSMHTKRKKMVRASQLYQLSSEK